MASRSASCVATPARPMKTKKVTGEHPLVSAPPDRIMRPYYSSPPPCMTRVYMYWTPPAQVIFNPHATPTASSSTDSLLAAADVAESAADVAAAVGAKVAAAGPPLPKPLLPEVAAPLVAPGGQ